MIARDANDRLLFEDDRVEDVLDPDRTGTVHRLTLDIHGRMYAVVVWDDEDPSPAYADSLYALSPQ